MDKNEKSDKSKKQTTYTIEDAIKIADDILKLSSEKKYNIGAFIHGLAFALEYTTFSFKIPQQQIALIKRDCRKYLTNVEKTKEK